MNPETGKGWKAIYTPDVLAVGEGPSTWTDYFNQQKRWARGTCDVIRQHSPSLLRRLSPRQKLAYAALQAYYPGVALTWLFGNGLMTLALVGGIMPLPRNAAWLLPLWASINLGQYGLILFLRQFNLAEHERRELALNAIVLTAVTGPVYAAAAVGAVLRRRLSFVVTGKGALANRDGPATFKYHFCWLMLTLSGLLVAWKGHGIVASAVWAGLAVTWAGLPVVMSIGLRRPSLG
jgi:hypothetical protein